MMHANASSAFLNASSAIEAGKDEMLAACTWKNEETTVSS
jgi:hypothetical protein